MRTTTFGQLLINEALPRDLRNYERVLDKKGINNLLQQVAKQYPERYREVTKALSDVGRVAAYSTGGQSFGLRSLKTAPSALVSRERLRRKLDQLHNDKSLSDDQREAAIITAIQTEQATLADAVFADAKREGNPLADQVMSGSRGNHFNLNSLLGNDLLYTDTDGEPVPIPVMRSYSEGLSPAEYFAGAYGARKGIVDVKSATQDAGFFSKQLMQAAHRLLVTANDDEEEYDENSPRGLPVSTDDTDNEGALLAHPVGDYPRNTVLTPAILKDLRDQDIEHILVRSPGVGGPDDGGVYARDVGVRERSRISPVGDYVGLAGGHALAEPITQSQLSSKHTGGVAGAAGAGAISGFKYINQLVQVPKTFKGGAKHAQLDGRVTTIEDAPQGGKFVTIGNEKHYIGQGFKVSVKRGDTIEAGDVISEGTPNPAEIVKHKGIGEGRRYFVELFRNALADADTYGNRRNIELIARGLINHVQLTDEVGDYVPDDVVPYQTLEKQWRPREGAQERSIKSSVGRYLEKPVLHYTIGTRIQPSMLRTMKRYGVQNVLAHDDPPPFQPRMIRAMENVSHDPDWMARLLGGYQQRSLLQGVHRGATSDSAGTSFVAPLAQAKDFGLSGKTRGWKTEDDLKGRSVLD